MRLPETLELVVRPGTVLGRAAAGEPSFAAVAGAFAAPLAAVSAFYAYSYVGAVTAGHFLANAALHAAVFAVQAAIALVLGRQVGGRRRRAVLHAYALTFLPLELFFLFLLGVLVVAPAPYDTLFALARTLVLPVAFGVVLLWSALLTFVAFRALAGGRRLVAAAATVAHYAVFGGLVTAYIYGMGLLPLPAGA